jgi:hypothetical protein
MHGRAQEAKAGKAETTDLVALNPKKKLAFELVEKIELSTNTRLFRFALQSPNHRLGLPIGQHMFFYAKVCGRSLLAAGMPGLRGHLLDCMQCCVQDKGEMVMRAYTPTSSDDDLGHFDLVVKVYFSNQHKDFPEVCVCVFARPLLRHHLHTGPKERVPPPHRAGACRNTWSA